HDAQLLVRVAVQRHHRAGLELDQVEHAALAEERPPRNALRERERAHIVEADELRFHGAWIIAPERRPWWPHATGLATWGILYRLPRDGDRDRSPSPPGVHRRGLGRCGLGRDLPGRQ